jgi:curved DNA-binding protein CbpA
LDSNAYYAILGVSENAKYREIRAAYRLLARKHHPDRNNSELSKGIIRKINGAFEVLSDREKRRQYDETGLANVLLNEDQSNDDTSDSMGHYHDDRYANTKINIDDLLNDKLKTSTTDSLDIPKGRFHIIVDPSLCMAFGSCERLAPRVFVVEKEKLINPKAVVVSETGANFNTILAAAETCPTKAIRIIDRYTGKQIYP